jgi:hypothetical protein
MFWAYNIRPGRRVMAYWRMQLHPSEPSESVKDCVESLSAGYIGLDFASDVGDLMKVDRAILTAGEKDYLLFAHEMSPGDRMLIVAHHHPFALATVQGEYNYILCPSKNIGWFRHSRAVKDVAYYFDWETNPSVWVKITMTDTISPLRDQSSISYGLIEQWIAAMAVNGTG